MHRTSPATKATGSGAPSGALSLSDFLIILLGRLVSDASPEIERANGANGNLTVNLEVHLINGKPKWHSASAHFTEHQTYTKESIVGN